MRICLSILLLIFLIQGCNLKSKSFEQEIEEIRNEIRESAKHDNDRQLAWTSQTDSIYSISANNKAEAISLIDYLIKNDTSITLDNIYSFRYMKGEVYFRMDSLDQALSEFTASDRYSDNESPRTLSAKAAVYVKMKKYDEAKIALEKAAEINYDFNWELGNYFEIVGNEKLAINTYKSLYLRDTIFYKYCNDRIIEIETNKAKPIKELKLRALHREVILLNYE